MARENTVYLTGIVSTDVVLDDSPSIFEHQMAGFMINVMRFSYVNEEMKFDGRRRMDEIQVLCRNPKLIKDQIIDKQNLDGSIQTKINAGDGVTVKGTLVTLDTPKEAYCPNCGQLITKELAVIIFIDALCVTKVRDRDEIPDEESQMEFLRGVSEIGNQIYLHGVLLRDPELYDEDGHVPSVSFQLAVRRRRRIAADDETKKVDFPWVKIFGREKSENTMIALHKGSHIYINGAIQQRIVESTWTCGTCRTMFPYKDWAIEIIPYSIEYGKNCDSHLLVQDEPETEDLMEYGERSQNETIEGREIIW